MTHIAGDLDLIFGAMPVFDAAPAVVFGTAPAIVSTPALFGVVGRFRRSGHWNWTEFLTKSVTTACLQSQGIPRTSEKHPNLVMKADKVSV